MRTMAFANWLEVEDEEEDRYVPTNEELEYLELRQKLKESIRKKRKMMNNKMDDSSSVLDNFGTFFGPWQPVIAQKVIQESRKLLEKPHVCLGATARVPNGEKKGGGGDSKPKPTVQMLKERRDYSFLLSDDAGLPAPSKDPPERVHLLQKTPSSSGGKVASGTRLVPGVSPMRVKAGPQIQKSSSIGKKTSPSPDSGKQIGRATGCGPGRISGPVAFQSKIPVARKGNVISASGTKGSVPGLFKSQLHPKPPLVVAKKPLEQKGEDRASAKVDNMTKPGVVVAKRPLEQKRDDGVSAKVDKMIKPGSVVAKKPLEQKRDDGVSAVGDMMNKKSVLSAKPQVKQQEITRKRRVRAYSEDETEDDMIAIRMIRRMFGYNPNKYHDTANDDLKNMEAGFHDIIKEENRSLRIALKEDRVERLKIEEEERRERLRKEAKRRKLSQQ